MMKESLPQLPFQGMVGSVAAGRARYGHDAGPQWRRDEVFRRALGRSAEASSEAVLEPSS